MVQKLLEFYCSLGTLLQKQEVFAAQISRIESPNLQGIRVTNLVGDRRPKKLNSLSGFIAIQFDRGTDGGDPVEVQQCIRRIILRQFIRCRFRMDEVARSRERQRCELLHIPAGNRS